MAARFCVKIAKVDTEKHLILIEGAVPGAKNGLVLVRHAVKKFEGGRKRKG
jgi:large subunit ribosomal protein L3